MPRLPIKTIKMQLRVVEDLEWWPHTTVVVGNKRAKEEELRNNDPVKVYRVGREKGCEAELRFRVRMDETNT